MNDLRVTHDVLKLTLRLPSALLSEVDAFAAAASNGGTVPHTPSRNETLLHLLRRGLADATRPRKAKP